MFYQVSSALSCSLSGIDGSFVVNNTDGGATLQINKMYPGSESMAISRNGSITTLVDPDVRMNRWYHSIYSFTN